MKFYLKYIVKEKELMLFQTDHIKTATALTTKMWGVEVYGMNIIVQSI
jgi:hypothetical protein